MGRPRAKVTIDSLYEVIHEKSVGTKINDLDICLEVVSGHVIGLHRPEPRLHRLL